MSHTDEKIKIAICDDRDGERGRLSFLVSKYFDMHNISAKTDEYTCGEALIASDKNYDLIILDIIMNELNGIETAKKIRQENKTAQIIFCSTTREYAADSYDVSALYYLIKPVSEEKFFGALDLFFEAFQKCKTVTYKSNRFDEAVLVSDILWIESGKNHKIVIHTRFGKIETRTTMKELLSQLEGDDFILPIRYAAVNLAAVVTIPTDVLTLQSGETIPIARDKRSEMKALFTAYRMKMLLKKGGIE